jgi:hypothetical protein
MTAAFVGLLLHWWWFAAACGVLTLLGVLVWLWPERRLGQIARSAHG